MTASRSSLRSCVVLACVVAVSVGVSCKTARADDVTITGRRREVGATTLTRDELRELPGAFGDPGRAIEALPGVIPVGTAVPFSSVRGATPSDTAYFLDGMRVPMFSHWLPGGSVVAGSTIDRVDFFPGAAPARFGGATGGVLSVTTLPPAERARAEVAARLYDSSALVAGRPYSRTVHGVLVGPYNQDRLPPVHRVDLRVEKKWLLDRERSVSLVLEGFNVTLAREVVQCRPDALVPGGPVPEAYVNGRLPDACRFERSPAFTIPGIGVEGSF